MRAALVQLCSGPDPVESLAVLRPMIAAAARQGADLIATPEVTNAVVTGRAAREATYTTEPRDPTLAGLREEAARHGRWIAVGSLALRQGERFVNRSFLIDPSGAIAARYDKIHMFDVAVSETETYTESAAFAAGERAIIATTPFGVLGLSICYDLRFPHLYRALAAAGAQVLLVPSAFSTQTGPAHWETLLRARAIETGSFVLAAAQSGRHGTDAKARRTYGHSLAVDPWGRVLVDGGTAPGVMTVDLDLDLVRSTRAAIPALAGGREFAIGDE